MSIPQEKEEEPRAKMRFHNRFDDAVIDEFGKDIMLAPINKDHFKVILRVQVSPPFYSWVTMFGRGVQILSLLKQQIR